MSAIYCTRSPTDTEGCNMNKKRNALRAGIFIILSIVLSLLLSIFSIFRR